MCLFEKKIKNLFVKSHHKIISLTFFNKQVFRPFSPHQEKVLRMMYVWALCRDQEELNPYAAWRLLDISASSTEQIL